MGTCPQDALLLNGKALLCVIIILILLVAVSTSLTICQFFSTRRILQNSVITNQLDEGRNERYLPAHVRDTILFVNEKE